MSTTTELVGQSGRRYLIKRVLQEKEPPPRRVFLATAENELFIVKDIPLSDFDYYQDMYRDLQSCPNLRLLQDTIPEQLMFVYKYLTDHLLSLTRKGLPTTSTKRILKDALRGLAALHDHNIVHADIKPNNIMVEYKENHDGIVIEQVELADIEDAAYVPPGSNIVGRQMGNWMWRSPEAHAEGRVNKPSDMFSFAVVCIYAVKGAVIFAVDKDKLEEGVEVLSVVLERQLSYFADPDGLAALLEYLGDNPWRLIFEVIRDGFDDAHPREPAYLWRGIDADFKDLICRLTNFDPAKRLTAHEALAHRWFEDV